jgi:hypothetical protein
MYFVTFCRDKPDSQLVDMRLTVVDVYVKVAWAAVTLWLFTYLALPQFVEVNDDQIWPVVVTWVECVAFLAAQCVYISRYAERERFAIVMTSTLSVQALVLNALHAGVSIAFADSGEEQLTVPGNVLIFFGLSVPVVIDACNTTPTETRVSFIIMIVAQLMGVIGNMIFFDNAIIHEGLFATVDSQGRQVWTGQISKNGVRLNILYSEVVLLMGSLFTAFAYDQDHTQMYFSKLCRDKPDSQLVGGRKVSFRVDSQ